MLRMHSLSSGTLTSCLCERTQVLDTGDAPLVDVTLANTGRHEPSMVFCSSLCISMHRAAPNRSTLIEPGVTAESEAMEEDGLAGDGGKESDGQDEDEDDVLIVLPPAIKESERVSQSQLQRLMHAEAGGGAAVSRRAQLRQQLRGTAFEIKKEEARTTGRYLETETSQLEPFEDFNGHADSDRAELEEESGEDEDADETEEAAEEAPEEAPVATADATNECAEMAGPAGGDSHREAGDGLDTVAEATAPAYDTNDELSALMAAKRAKAAELEAMRERVDKEMQAAMDTGVRVNPALAQALGVEVPARLQPVDHAQASEIDAADEDGAPSVGKVPVPETQEDDDKYLSRIPAADACDLEAAGQAEEQHKPADGADAADSQMLETAAVTETASLIAPAPPKPFVKTYGFKRKPQQTKLGFAAGPSTFTDQRENGGVGPGASLPKSVEESLADHEAEMEQMERAEGELRAAGSAESAPRQPSSSLVLDEAEDADDEVDGSSSRAHAAEEEEDDAGEEEDEDTVGIVADADAEEEGADEGSHIRMAAELEAADDERQMEAYVDGLRKRAKGDVSRRPAKRSRKNAADDKAADQSEESGSEADQDANGESDDEALSSIGEFIASDEDEDLEAEEAERDAAAREAENEDEDEETAVDRVIRNRLGAAWIVADRSAPALERSPAGKGGGDDGATAARFRVELRAKRKREKEIEEANAANAAAEKAEVAAEEGMRGSRLFASFERSLSSFSAFSVLSDNTLGSAPAPKRQASASGIVPPPNLAASHSFATSSGSSAPRAPTPLARALSANNLDGSSTSGSNATASNGTIPPPPIFRLSSFQDKGRFTVGSKDRTREVMAQLGGSASGTTTTSKAFVFRAAAENSQAGTTGSTAALDEPSIDRSAHEHAFPTDRRGGTSASSSHPARGSSAKDRRTPPPMPSKSGAGSRGNSLLATVLNGTKNWKRAAAASK